MFENITKDCQIFSEKKINAAFRKEISLSIKDLIFNKLFYLTQNFAVSEFLPLRKMEMPLSIIQLKTVTLLIMLMRRKIKNKLSSSGFFQ